MGLRTSCRGTSLKMTANPNVTPPILYSAVHLIVPRCETNSLSKTKSLYTYSLCAIQSMRRASGSPMVSEHRYSSLLLEGAREGMVCRKVFARSDSLQITFYHCSSGERWILFFRFFFLARSSCAAEILQPVQCAKLQTTVDYAALGATSGEKAAARTGSARRRFTVRKRGPVHLTRDQ